MTPLRSSLIAVGAVVGWFWFAAPALRAQAPAPAAPAAAAPVPPPQSSTEAASPNEKPAVEEKLIPTHSILEIVARGGVLMYPIIVASFILLIFVFERALVLRKNRVIPAPFVKRFLHQLREGQLDRPRAIELCKTNPSPVAVVFEHALRKWGKPAVEVEQAVLDGGERVVNQLRRNLRVVNGVATISPLLGLLGTVTGMISTFNAIASSQAMGRPEMLALGIGEALLTTAAGLCVAIPALIFHMLLVGRVDQLTMDLDALGQELVQLISAEGSGHVPRPKGAKRSAAAAPASSPAAAAEAA